jgi:hypothetical protein
MDIFLIIMCAFALAMSFSNVYFYVLGRNHEEKRQARDKGEVPSPDINVGLTLTTREKKIDPKLVEMNNTFAKEIMEQNDEWLNGAKKGK